MGNKAKQLARRSKTERANLAEKAKKVRTKAGKWVMPKRKLPEEVKHLMQHGASMRHLNGDVNFRGIFSTSQPEIPFSRVAERHVGASAAVSTVTAELAADIDVLSQMQTLAKSRPRLEEKKVVQCTTFLQHSFPATLPEPDDDALRLVYDKPRPVVYDSDDDECGWSYRYVYEDPLARRFRQDVNYKHCSVDELSVSLFTARHFHGLAVAVGKKLGEYETADAARITRDQAAVKE